MAHEVRQFLGLLERAYPDDIVRITEPVNPSTFDVTAVLQHLENRDKYPVVIFERPLALTGEVSRFPLVSNLYGSRERCALMLGLDPGQAGLGLSLEYAHREADRIKPAVVTRAEAPVKDRVYRGEEADLRLFPIVRHHAMDPAPYVDMAPIMRDPHTGIYNVAFQRAMYKGPRKLGLYMSPRHNWQIARQYEEMGRPTPVAIVVSHHPAFYLGALNVSPYDAEDYEVVGSIMGAPVRLVPSETFGEDLMVPADAEIIIEGEIPPGVREIEGPFGEFPGTYGPQRLSWVINVTAITHRQDAIYQDIFVGHRETHIMGGIPKEGSIFNRIKGVVPTVKGVSLPLSAAGRFHCYISIDKKVDGESKQAALIALGECDFVKHVVVVDADIDPFREEEVLWAVATRVQADQDVDIIKNVKSSVLDPSQINGIMGTKMIIDATRPVRRPFSERIQVPAEAMARIDLDRLLSARALARTPSA